MDIWGITAVAWLVSLLGAAPGGAPCLDLVGLDGQRSAAYAAASSADLAELYVSPQAAAPDVQRLEEWSQRGLTVPAAMLVIGRCQVVASTADHIDLVVIDQLAPTFAVDAAGEHLVLPRDGWSERSVRLQLVDGRWRYAGSTP